MAAKLPAAAVATALVMMACLLPLPAALGTDSFECYKACRLTVTSRNLCCTLCAYTCLGTSAVGTETISVETSLFPVREEITEKGGVQLWYCMNGCAAAKRCSQAEGKEASACFMACGLTCGNRSALPSKSVVADA